MNAAAKPLEGEVLDHMPAVATDQTGTALAHQANPYLGLIETMVSRGGDLSNLDKMLDLQIKWEANEARKAYHEAVAAFKAEPPKVYRDKENKQYSSRYVSLANMVNTVNAALSVHGLSARWDADQSGQIKVTCTLSHVQGHSESVSLSGPPDTSGAKNNLQQIKSTLTYLKLATFELVTGVASEEGNLDDDGNGASSGYDISEWRDAISDASDKAELDSLAKELKGAKIPSKELKQIRALWSARARELAE